MDGVDCNCIEGVTQVFKRIFPLHRGLFEDKVLLLLSLMFVFVVKGYIYIYIYIYIKKNIP